MQDCKLFLTLVKLFFCIISKAEHDEELLLLLLLTQNHRFFHLTSPEVSVRQNSGRKVDIWVRSNDSLFSLCLSSISTFPKSHFTSSPPLLLFKIKPHTGGFCHELPHWGHCYLHERAASAFLCWNTTQENG